MDIPVREITTSTQLFIKDEFDSVELSEKIMSVPAIMIKGLTPGCGKSYAFMQIAKQYPETKILFVTPYNCLNMDIRSKGVTAITINILLGEGVGDFAGKMTAYNSSNFDMIVFDEIYLHPVRILELIAKYMSTHANLRFGATGDEYQLSAIDPGLCIPSKMLKAYYNRIISSMFPVFIILELNKRCSDDGVQMSAFLREILASKKSGVCDILVKYGVQIESTGSLVTTDNNVCLQKDMCQQVARRVQSRINSPTKYFVGMVLIANNSVRKVGGSRLYVNAPYQILSVNEERYTLTDNESLTFEMWEKDLIKNFALPYARTCNSLQGTTVSGRLGVWQMEHGYADICWIYTALSRVTKLSNLCVYMNLSQHDVDLTDLIKSRILNHRQSDINRVIVGEYVSAPWVLQQLDQCNARCAECGITMDLITSSESQFSIDRLDNNLAHVQSNCRVICRQCNVKLK